MKNNTIFTLGVIAFLLIISLSFLFLQPVSNIVTGATEDTAISNVSISKFLSISLSTNLGNGITFDTVNTVPATDVNASDNYNGASSSSTMFINVSTDSNVNVDFCIKADFALNTSGNDVIGLGNETYFYNLSTNLTVPGPSTSARYIFKLVLDVLTPTI